jgi:isopenicillin N synthase-like dioxygenase
MENYFMQPDELKMLDVMPELAYQVGATPSGVEKPKILAEDKSGALRTAAIRSEASIPTGADPKWRFFWRIGQRDESVSSRFKELNAPPVVPPVFAPSWAEIMNDWGERMLEVATLVAALLERGLNLPRAHLTQMMVNGPHLLAPTGSNLGDASLAKEGTILAGYHSDLNFLTVHGRSRFPGLNIFTRGGRKVEVEVPEGCLFIQAGKQVEWLTGGHILAGYHEVVVLPSTLRCVDEAKEKGQKLWRVSSTFFSHINSQQVLQPLGRFASLPLSAGIEHYPPVLCGDQVQAELAAINLKDSTNLMPPVKRTR